ncbi:MAG: phage major tail tube protein [Selenomonadaceae bacterium]|nr:phage major tail tube protein [Selenomonadaceae bacterium]MBR4384105.1 phage major tail tube protein [Selenomonadaceae bacterium]
MGMQDTLEQVINYEVFVDGGRCLGTASVDLPEINYMTQDIKGAGIAGQYSAPTLGHLDSLEIKLTFRAIYESPISLMEQKAVILSLRGAIQQYDSATGVLKALPVRIDGRGRIKGGAMGKFEPSELTDTEITFECDVISIKVNNVELFMHDKLNFVNRVNGQDYLAPVRLALGI